ncbi:hypothetical protein B9Z55_025215 [Caenorhabditis nigoni]|uniref:Uncharacterized protein n=1 Tax=Caenorhabditis nigoni TaxID=1611254 RepID=A0A2G5SY03_9PELO|nr:hypothetical protein B9Z55_025215 [Caenorhabditis nigoni]
MAFSYTPYHLFFNLPPRRCKLTTFSFCLFAREEIRHFFSLVPGCVFLARSENHLYLAMITTGNIILHLGRFSCVFCGTVTQVSLSFTIMNTCVIKT